MKKILLPGLLIIGSLLAKPADAQFNVSINIGSQPAWGPSGYNYAEYYYMPEIEAYYWVPRHQFVYLDGGNWMFSASLPARCRNYDLYSGYKVVINEPRPWMHFNDHRSRYAPYCNRHDQIIIRDYDRGGRYYNGRGRGWDNDRGWNNDRRGDGDWKGDRHDNGRHRGHDRRW